MNKTLTVAAVGAALLGSLTLAGCSGSAGAAGTPNATPKCSQYSDSTAHMQCESGNLATAKKTQQLVDATKAAAKAKAATAYTLPNLVGQTIAAANQTLAQAGVVAGGEPSGEPGSDVVQTQSPAPGIVVYKGDTVTLSGKAPMTVSQQQAVLAAQNYLSIGSGFSATSLEQQLTSSYGNGFSAADAQFAIAYLNPDWNAQAVDAARGYMQVGGFSHASLIEQLTSSYGNGFTEAQAEYAVAQVGL